MKMMSLKSRFCLSIFPLLIVIVTTVAIIAHWQMEQILYDHIDRILQVKCHGILAVLDAVADSDEQETRINFLLDNAQGPNRTWFWIWTHQINEQLLTNASHLPVGALGDAVKAEMLVSRALENPFSMDIQDTEHRLKAIIHSLSQRSVQILIAYPSQTLHDELHRFLWFLFTLGALVVAVAVGVSLGAVRWALHPVNRAADLLKRISWAHSGDVDMDQLDVPPELAVFKQALGDMLDRLSQFVTRQKQFTANAAHELRTPVTLAKSTVQAAFCKPYDYDRCRQAMTDVLGDLDRMADLVEQLQLLSYLDETKQLPDVIVLALTDVLQDLVHSYDQKTPDRVFVKDSTAVHLPGNRDLLLSLFRNLVDNALKHGPIEGPVQISMQVSTDGDTVTVEVHDEGGQISSEDLSRLTERFYRPDSSRSRHTGGAGLGLAIAHEIVQKHHGRLSIESQPETGTCVSVELPVET